MARRGEGRRGGKRLREEQWGGGCGKGRGCRRGRVGIWKGKGGGERGAGGRMVEEFVSGRFGKGPERAESGGRGRYVLYFNVYKIVRFTKE